MQGLKGDSICFYLLSSDPLNPQPPQTGLLNLIPNAPVIDAPLSVSPAHQFLRQPKRGCLAKEPDSQKPKIRLCQRGNWKKKGGAALSSSLVFAVTPRSRMQLQESLRMKTWQSAPPIKSRSQSGVQGPMRWEAELDMEWNVCAREPREN